MSKKLFRALVTANIVVLVSIGPIGVAMVDTLPPELRSYVTSESYASLGPIAYLGLGVIGAYLIAYIGLLFFSHWARPLLVLSVVCGAAVTFFYGPYVTTGMESMIFEVSALMDGAILALAYCSTLRAEFRDGAV